MGSFEGGAQKAQRTEEADTANRSQELGLKDKTQNNHNKAESKAPDNQNHG